MDSGFTIKEQNALVTSSYTFQVSHVSVSTVCMESLSFPSFIASSRWRIILVSACSWVHGASFARSLRWLDNTSELYVLITSLLLSLVMDVTMVARKAKSSILFSSMRRNSCQFPGIVLEACTRLRLKSTGLCLNSTGPKQCQRYLRAVIERQCMEKDLFCVVQECLGRTRS